MSVPDAEVVRLFTMAVWLGATLGVAIAMYTLMDFVNFVVDKWEKIERKQKKEKRKKNK